MVLEASISLHLSLVTLTVETNSSEKYTGTLVADCKSPVLEDFTVATMEALEYALNVSAEKNMISWSTQHVKWD